MKKVLVFIPCSLYGSSEGYLYGTVQAPSCFYVLGTEQQTRLNAKDKLTTIGYFQPNNDSYTRNPSISVNNKTWVHVRLVHSQLNVHCETEGRIVVIVYDDKVLRHSELLLDSEKFNEVKANHFKTLATLLKEQTQSQGMFAIPLTTSVVCLFLQVATVILKSVAMLRPVLEYSSLGSHLRSFLETLVWALTCLRDQKKLSLKVGNYFLSTFIDICGGVLLLHIIADYVRITDPLSEHLLLVAKGVVRSLQELLQWLSGSPAGLKLNLPFNVMMGRFFVYHIHLWWIFLSVTRSMLDLAFQGFLALGTLGLTFQAAIVADLLALVSFHIYCIYVYAARLYYLQLSGLLALWRLFLGRKYNPLRNRVDSCQYTPDQLFVGTLAFTILLFLLPTTLMYYIVFTMMRLILLGLAGVLTHASYFVRALPVYATFHWLLGSNTVCSSVSLTPASHNIGDGSNTLVLFVSPIADSWWKTVHNCVPDTVLRPPVVQCGQLIQKLTCGELVHR